jgi:hypothetical protein
MRLPDTKPRRECSPVGVAGPRSGSTPGERSRVLPAFWGALGSTCADSALILAQSAPRSVGTTGGHSGALGLWPSSSGVLPTAPAPMRRGAGNTPAGLSFSGEHSRPLTTGCRVEGDG